MRPLAAEDIVDLARYEVLRPDYRKRVIAHKRNRRLAVGENVTLVFEDRETLRFQIQEMLWVEQVSEPAKVREEVDVYNELLPGDRELSATLFIEITDAEEIRPELEKLIGIDEHLSLQLGDDDHDVETIPASFDPDQMEEDRISAVQYLRFSLTAAQVERLADPRVYAVLRIDHRNYRREAELPPALREHLVRDLTGEPEPLLDAEQARAVVVPEDAVVLEQGSVRAVKPRRARAPGHIIVEPIAPSESVLELPPELDAELLALVRRVAREVYTQHGSARVTADVDPDADRVRWHVYSLGR